MLKESDIIHFSVIPVKNNCVDIFGRTLRQKIKDCFSYEFYSHN